MKHKTINGWTKELMKAQIRLNMRAMSRNTETCTYRSVYEGKPNACAVGCFIPDRLYKAWWDYEGELIGTILNSSPKLKGVMPLKELGLFKLQSAHDYFRGYSEDCAEHVCKWIDENVENGE